MPFSPLPCAKRIHFDAIFAKRLSKHFDKIDFLLAPRSLFGAFRHMYFAEAEAEKP
jgi:hypothetical protein